jgi:serine/threonine-protein kinase
LPGYEGLEWIGEGGMGVVYRARDLRLKRVVAVKMIRSAQFSPERLAWFQAEAEAPGRLQHPHVVQVFAREESGGQPVLVMEHVSGGTLDDLLRQGPLSAAEAARLVAILARAVQYAHASGVVHRDLKPANVLLAPPVEGNSGTVRGAFPKISDFGLARLTDERARETAGVLQGTPAYMAPEQAEGVAPVGPAADLWALGVILYRALTGLLPFDADNAEELLRRVKQADPLPPRRIVPDVPADLERACLLCLSKDPARRPSAAGLAHLLEYALPQTDDATRELPPPARPVRKPYRRAAFLLAAFVAALALYRLFPSPGSGPQGPAAESTPAHLAIPAEEGPHPPLQVTSYEVIVAGTGLALSKDVRGASRGIAWRSTSSSRSRPTLT